MLTDNNCGFTRTLSILCSRLLQNNSFHSNQNMLFQVETYLLYSLNWNHSAVLLKILQLKRLVLERTTTATLLSQWTSPNKTNLHLSLWLLSPKKMVSSLVTTSTFGSLISSSQTRLSQLQQKSWLSRLTCLCKWVWQWIQNSLSSLFTRMYNSTTQSWSVPQSIWKLTTTTLFLIRWGISKEFTYSTNTWKTEFQSPLLSQTHLSQCSLVSSRTPPWAHTSLTVGCTQVFRCPKTSLRKLQFWTCNKLLTSTSSSTQKYRLPPSWTRFNSSSKSWTFSLKSITSETSTNWSNEYSKICRDCKWSDPIAN